MLLRASALRKAYAGRTLFNGLSFELTIGSAIAVTGPNGSGKSTLLRILAGLDQPDAGNLNGVRAAVAAPWTVPPPELTGNEIIRYCTGRITRDAREAAAALRLDNDLARRAGDYSSGMLQKLALICALTAPRDLILLDEPFSHLDTDSAATAEQLIARRAESAALVIAGAIPRAFSCREIRLG
jgi:ABC-type multidrug transport system ATPase subunit